MDKEETRELSRNFIKDLGLEDVLLTLQHINTQFMNQKESWKRITLTLSSNSDSDNWKTMEVQLEDLRIDGYGLNTNIEYNDVCVCFDNNQYNGGINIFLENDVSPEFLFISVLNSYIRDDTTFTYGPEWAVFDRIKVKPNEEGLVLVLLQYDGDDILPYALQYATPEMRFYYYFDNCILCNTDGVITVEGEEMYSEFLALTVASVIKGEERCLYKMPDIDEWIEEFGGPDSFVEEYSH